VRGWLRRSRDERGAVLVFVAIASTVMIGSAALAVDIGQETLNNRKLQTVADVIALDAARAAGGQTVSQLSGTSGAVTLAAQGAATRNNFPQSKLTVELGTKTGNGTFASLSYVIQNGTVVSPITNGVSVPNAARITTAGSVKFAFNPGTGTSSRSAVAVQEATAGFSIGSFLVGINTAQDTVLNQIFGDSFNVQGQLLSYNGLANANVSLAAIGLNMPVTALSPTQLLSTSVSAKNLMLASAAALNDGSHAAAVSVLNSMAASVTATTMVNLGNTMSIATGGQTAAANASVNVLQMLTAAAFFVDGTHAISIPQAQLVIPNVGSVDLTLNVISPAKTVFGPVGTTASTSQVQLTVTPHLNISTSGNINSCSLAGTSTATLLGGLLNLVGCLLGPLNKVLSLDLNAAIPISLTLAGAQGTLSNINCNGSPPTITITPQLQALNLTANVDLDFTGTLLGVNLGSILRIRANGGAITQSNPAAQVFKNPSEFGVPRTVVSSPLGLAHLTNLTATNVSVLNIDFAGLLNVLSTTVLGLVNAAMGAVDAVISPIIHMLGLGIGGADITALTGSLNCVGLRLAT
jgi:uncharacterized membrane protein